MKTIIYDGITNKKLEVDIVVVEHILSVGVLKFAHYKLNGEMLFRIETKGRTGKSLYKNSSYLDANCNQRPVMGSDGSTGHGWGGRVVGFMTITQIEQSKLNIK